MEIKFLGHASFMLRGDATVIYIDPYHLIGEQAKADIILITHPHFDHCSADDIKKVLSEKTIVLSPAGCDAGVPIREIAPGEEIALGDVIVRAVPAYNIGKNFHPKTSNWVGYVIDVEDLRIYHAGDTDAIPEMEHLSVDIAMIPIGGTYTMGVREALDAVEHIKPKLAIPMHYGDIVGTTEDAHNFCTKCKTKCRVLARNEVWKVEI